MSSSFEQFYQTFKNLVPKERFTIPQYRQNFALLMSFFPPAPDVHFTECSIGKLSCAYAHVPGCNPEQVILFFHGGGYHFGSIETHRDIMGRLARASGCYVFAIEYRLAPEHTFPAALEDAVIGYHYLLQEGISPQKIFVAGLSAGGGLVLTLCLKLLEQKHALPRGGICLSSWMDLALTGKTLNHHEDLIFKWQLKAAADNYLQGHDPQDPFASPLYGNLQGLPPLLIQIGSREILFDENERLAQKARESGVEVDFQCFPEMIHSWHLFASLIPEGQQAIEKIGEFIKSRLL